MTAPDIKRGWIEKANALTQAQQQDFLDDLHEGRTIGQAGERAGISFDAAMGCMEIFIQKSEIYSLAKVAGPKGVEP